jgi:hypothetical protein
MMSKSETKPAPEFKRPLPKRSRGRSLQTTLHVLFACVILTGTFALYFVFAGRALEPSTTMAASERAPVANHIGHVKFFGDHDCKKRMFDNSSGALTHSHPADCTGSTIQNPDSLYVTPTNRLEAVRRGFSNR